MRYRPPRSAWIVKSAPLVHYQVSGKPLDLAIMTGKWRPDFNPDFLYFITTATVQHKHLFEREVVRRLVVDTLDCMRLREKFKLYCFVVMPNHVHLIIHCQEETPFSAVMRDFKRQVADRLIRQYETENNVKALAFLASAVTRSEKQQYKVWEDDYDAKAISSTDFLVQKMTYIHNNPCQSHWMLAEGPAEYIWSSARFYLTGKRAIIPIDDAGLLLA